MSCAPPGSCSRSFSRPLRAAKYVSRWRSTPWSSRAGGERGGERGRGVGSRPLSSTLRCGAVAAGGTVTTLAGRRPVPVASRAMEGLTVVDHPLLARHVAVLRSADTSREEFRHALGEAAAILAYEATRELAREDFHVLTPLEPAAAQRPAKPIAVVAILRAGLGMVDGFLRLVPEAAIGHLGMRRNEETLQPEAYYESLPDVIDRATVFVVDPMLATGGSALAALTRLREAGATDLRLVCLVAAPEGVERVSSALPGLPIVVGALDRQLDEQGYIRPGLGDAGDRIFGTE